MEEIRNFKLVQSMNRLAVLKAIRRGGIFSKADLCSLTGLSHPTVSVILDGLVREGYVREVGYGESSGGRKPALFEFDPRSRHMIVIDFKRQEVVIGVLDLNTQVVERRLPGNLTDVEAVVEEVASLVAELGGPAKIIGIAVGMRGFVDAATGTLHWIPNVRWKDVPLKSMLEQRTGCAVAIDHNYNLAALGERHRGAGSHTGSLIFVNVGTGISAGLVIDKRIYRGWQGYAGEFGHSIIDSGGQPCECGSSGCLETVVSGAALARQAQQAVSEGRGQAILAAAGGDIRSITAASVLAAAEAGDETSLDMLRQGGKLLGMGVAGVVNLLNPEMVVVGGTLGQAPAFLEALLSSVFACVLPEMRSGLRVLKSELGGDAVLVGGAALLLEGWLKVGAENEPRTAGRKVAR